MLKRASGVAASMLLPQLERVAPVVTTSSTNSMCLPLRDSGEVTLKTDSTFFQRASRCLCVCVSLAMCLITELVSMGIPVTSDSPRAM